MTEFELWWWRVRYFFNGPLELTPEMKLSMSRHIETALEGEENDDNRKIAERLGLL